MKIQLLETKKKQEYIDKFKLEPFVAKVFSAMDLKDDQIDQVLHNTVTIFNKDLSFLNPILNCLYDAKIHNKKVFIAGDYDCDGICATTIIYDALTKYGITCGYYIPNRFKEGYGLHINTVKSVIDKGYDILITVDNGVKSTEALQYAKEQGICVILTDHHNYDEKELVYDYFLHPSILDADYQYMCGAGIAFLIAAGLIGITKEHVVLAGIATIADIVPIWGMNRALIKECLVLLNQNVYPQIQYLQNDRSRWDEKKVAFQIVPKINSVGRLADKANVNTVVRYLLLKDAAMMDEFSKQLNALNNERKSINDHMVSLAEPLLDTTSLFHILHHSDFHEGINGILASKIAKDTLKPTMCLSEKEDSYVGSIRSDSVDLRTFFDGLDVLTAYGGHKQAAGIRFPKKDLPIVKSYIDEKMKNQDTEVTLSCLKIEEIESVIENFVLFDKMKPFGQNFELPLFIIEPTIIDSQTMSGGKHLKLIGKTMEFIYFNHGMDKFLIPDFNDYYYIGRIEINRFRGNQTLTMFVEMMVSKTEL